MFNYIGKVTVSFSPLKSAFKCVNYIKKYSQFLPIAVNLNTFSYSFLFYNQRPFIRFVSSFLLKTNEPKKARRHFNPRVKVSAQLSSTLSIFSISLFVKVEQKRFLYSLLSTYLFVFINQRVFEPLFISSFLSISAFAFRLLISAFFSLLLSQKSLFAEKLFSISISISTQINVSYVILNVSKPSVF